VLPQFLLMSKLAKYLGTIKLKHQPITTKQASLSSSIVHGGGKWQGLIAFHLKKRSLVYMERLTNPLAYSLPNPRTKQRI
jgi:hypothetical protein